MPNQERPICPNCGKEMTLARVWPGFGGMREHRSFECKPCGTIETIEIKSKF
jgi:predicted RNA-binding Zn-ribbon protein involved in translation (DUF1610 family)